jgi:hypothetical protein
MTHEPLVTVVSGLPRSGTSMMMRMLEAGGLPVVVDRDREPDPDNPNGYYEYQPVKTLDSDASWMSEALGSAVKIIYVLLYHLPLDYRYRVIFMRRDVSEVVRSQEAMMRRLGTTPAADDGIDVAQIFKAQLQRLDAWLTNQPNIDVLNIDYREVIDEPQRAAERVAAFLGGLDVEAMARVVNPQLYRQRAPARS